MRSTLVAARGSSLHKETFPAQRFQRCRCKTEEISSKTADGAVATNVEDRKEEPSLVERSNTAGNSPAAQI